MTDEIRKKAEGEAEKLHIEDACPFCDDSKQITEDILKNFGLAER